MATRIDRLPTTKISRRACNMRPDPCPGDDYIISGVSVYGDHFEAVVHHRGRGVWLMEDGDLRQTWVEFRSLAEVVRHLEG